MNLRSGRLPRVSDARTSDRARRTGRSHPATGTRTVILKKLQGKKTYLAAAGFMLLGVFQLSSGQVPMGIQSLMAALTAFGLRSAIERSSFASKA